MTGEKVAPALAEWSAQDERGGGVKAPSIAPDTQFFQRTIRAEARGSSLCTAEGITVCASSPVLELCRQLIAAGFDADRPLDVWRGGTLALSVRSIGAGAALEIGKGGVGFQRRCGGDGAAHVQQNEPGRHP